MYFTKSTIMPTIADSFVVHLANQEWGSIADITTAIATGLAILVARRAIKAKRKDDRRADRLNRVNRQLSEFYGKLSILFKVGMRDWCSFIAQYGNDSRILGREFVRFFPFEGREDEPITAFNPIPPNAEQLKVYRRWLKIRFIETDERMAEVIYANADLVIGGIMPQVLVLSAEHVASVKMMQLTLAEEELKEKDGIKSAILDDWREYVNLMTPYPKDIGHYINASFEVLKAEQERLLSTHDKPLTEKMIEARIKQEMWEKENYWGIREQKARAAAGQYYEYKPAPQPEVEMQKNDLIARWRRLI